MENLEILVKELCKFENETPWLEFKHNNYTPETIGKDISAIANAAALHERNCGYMIWGIHDKTHEILGTDFDQHSLKKGNEEIENWLRQMLSSNAEFEFHSIDLDDYKVVILIICAANSRTVMFQKVDYIRIGSYTKKLCDYPAVQAQLWDRLRLKKFEELIAKKDLEPNEVASLLDFAVYFDIKSEPQPSDLSGVIHYLLEECIVVKQDNGLFGITNMGALLFSKKLSDFPSLSRKAVRVVQYKGDNRLTMLREEVGTKGYVAGFEGLLKYIEALLPTEEVIRVALRETESAYPSLAVREAVANALIHQDFSLTGTGPVIEIFDNRIEITNPGTPLVDVKRIIDNPPKSRNEKLAALMRRLRMCEELGTGWDKIAISCELKQLPAPKIDIYQENTRVTLYSYVPFANLSSEDRLRSCYFHACIKQIEGKQITNSSLRERFGIKDSYSGSISRLIKEAVKGGLIKPFDPDTAPRYMRYIPWWA